MRLPRDVSGKSLVEMLARLGYAVSRQTGSHIRLTTQEHGEHHLTIPNHDPLRVGTLAGAAVVRVAQPPRATVSSLLFPVTSDRGPMDAVLAKLPAAFAEGAGGAAGGSDPGAVTYA